MTDEITTIELAPVAAKNALAKRAWDGLPMERRHRDNLEILRDAARMDPAHFLALCRAENLPVDLSIVVNNHHETHNHYHGAQDGGITRSDLMAMAEMMRSQPQPQQQGLTADDVRAIVQSVQPQQTGITREDLMMAMQAMQPMQPPPYYPEPSYYQPPQYQQQPMVFSPHIEVNATSHSEQDNGGAGGRVLACFLILFCFALGLSAGGR